MRSLELLRTIRQKLSHYQPMVEVTIYRDRLLHNLHEYQQKFPHLTFAPVLKSNAYGHGLVLVARILDRERIAFFVVDSYFEAKVLREAGIRSKILIIGFTEPAVIAQNKLKNLNFTITSLDQLKLLDTIKNKTTIHLKIDTGLHRQGVLPEELAIALASFRQNNTLILEGICSHLAEAEDSELTSKQVAIWHKVVAQVEKEYPDILYKHLAASGGAETVSEAGNVVRLGRGLYGIASSLNLKPTLSMQAVISGVKDVKPGARIGYSGTYIAKKAMKIATVSIGYYEGIDRRLSDKGFMEVNGQMCPIVGRVSMNITAIDVSTVSKVKLGDPVVVISSERGNKNSVESMAELADTIPHEILVHIPQQLRRTVR
jgi:alanine racemase